MTYVLLFWVTPLNRCVLTLLCVCRWCQKRHWWGHLDLLRWIASHLKTCPDKVTHLFCSPTSPAALWLVLGWFLLVYYVLVEFLEAVRQQVQKFQVQYIGNLPVSRAMGRTPVTPEHDNIQHCEWLLTHKKQTCNSNHVSSKSQVTFSLANDGQPSQPVSKG